MAAKGCIVNVCVKVHFLEGDLRGCLGGDELVLPTSWFDENRR